MGGDMTVNCLDVLGHGRRTSRRCRRGVHVEHGWGRYDHVGAGDRRGHCLFVVLLLEQTAAASGEQNDTEQPFRMSAKLLMPSTHGPDIIGKPATVPRGMTQRLSVTMGDPNSEPPSIAFGLGWAIDAF
jgi:hypothetical protein